MKKIFFTLFFLISTISFSRSEKIILVDYPYLLDNYIKTKSYNKTLKLYREKLEKTYNINFDDRKESENKKIALKAYNDVKNNFINEVNRDINLAIAFKGQTERYDFILEKEALRFGKGKDISKDILEFLNGVYYHNFTIKDSKNLKSDLFIL